MEVKKTSINNLVQQFSLSLIFSKKISTFTNGFAIVSVETSDNLESLLRNMPAIA